MTDRLRGGFMSGSTLRLLPSGETDREEPSQPSRRLRVALVNMPWARLDAPSIQCGLLQAIVRKAGHDCHVHYLNLGLADMLGGKIYDGIANVRSERLNLLGEWLFSYSAFGVVTGEDEYFAEYPELESEWRELTGQDLDHLSSLRRQGLPGWIKDTAELSDWGDYDVVGFSSTFAQNTASLALGRWIKQLHPAVKLVYGGANFDGEMGVEYLRTLPWLDYVVSGEGDIAFPALLHAIADGAPTPVHGVHGQNVAAAAGSSDSPRLGDLDTLPWPDYRDYFTQLEGYGRGRILSGLAVKLPVEFSRGCWWGQKHHCTFCGLNGLGMNYRAKSGPRALEELSGLIKEYPTVHIEAVDNILDMKYISSVCAELAERHWDVNIFFEVKANLTRTQLAMLSRAGVLRIQPGIESLSTNVLRLMRKGSTKLLNIRLLKWARYYGIDVAWNVLAGFPGESDEDYAEQRRLLPLLHHFQPPMGCAKIWLERFSPYFTDPLLSISNIRPRGSYRHIYPDTLDHGKIAYFFEHDSADVCSDEAVDSLRAGVAAWSELWTARPASGRPKLIYQRLPGRMVLIDTRTEHARRTVLEDWRADAYEACGDAPRSVEKVGDELAAAGYEVSLASVRQLLDRCCRSGIAVEEDGKYLALALPENPGW